MKKYFIILLFFSNYAHANLACKDALAAFNQQASIDVQMDFNNQFPTQKWIAQATYITLKQLEKKPAQTINDIKSIGTSEALLITDKIITTYLQLVPSSRVENSSEFIKAQDKLLMNSVNERNHFNKIKSRWQHSGQNEKVFDKLSLSLLNYIKYSGVPHWFDYVMEQEDSLISFDNLLPKDKIPAFPLEDTEVVYADVVLNETACFKTNELNNFVYGSSLAAKTYFLLNYLSFINEPQLNEFLNEQEKYNLSSRLVKAFKLELAVRNESKKLYEDLLVWQQSLREVRGLILQRTHKVERGVFLRDELGVLEEMKSPEDIQEQISYLYGRKEVKQALPRQFLSFTNSVLKAISSEIKGNDKVASRITMIILETAKDKSFDENQTKGLNKFIIRFASHAGRSTKRLAAELLKEIAAVKSEVISLDVNDLQEREGKLLRHIGEIESALAKWRAAHEDHI